MVHTRVIRALLHTERPIWSLATTPGSLAPLTCHMQHSALPWPLPPNSPLFIGPLPAPLASSPLAHLSSTASGSGCQHHPPLNSSRFLPGQVQRASATATVQVPTDTGASPALESSPALKILLAAPRLLLIPKAPANFTSTTGNCPKSTTSREQPQQRALWGAAGGYEAVLPVNNKPKPDVAAAPTRALSTSSSAPRAPRALAHTGHMQATGTGHVCFLGVFQNKRHRGRINPSLGPVSSAVVPIQGKAGGWLPTQPGDRHRITATITAPARSAQPQWGNSKRFLTTIS